MGNAQVNVKNDTHNKSFDRISYIFRLMKVFRSSRSSRSFVESHLRSTMKTP